MECLLKSITVFMPVDEGEKIDPCHGIKLFFSNPLSAEIVERRDLKYSEYCYFCRVNINAIQLLEDERISFTLRESIKDAMASGRKAIKRDDLIISVLDWMHYFKEKHESYMPKCERV